jgi:hypothetical protein
MGGCDSGQGAAWSHATDRALTPSAYGHVLDAEH